MQEFDLKLFGFLFFAQRNAQYALLKLTGLVPKQQAYEHEEHNINYEGFLPTAEENAQKIGTEWVFDKAVILREVNDKLEDKV